MHKSWLFHSLGDGLFSHKPLYSQGFLRFQVSYLGIRATQRTCGSRTKCGIVVFTYLGACGHTPSAKH